MMHMWFWWGYDLGEFLFKGLEISTKWTFAITWVALFFAALLFEASKVYLANIQRKAQKRFSLTQGDERRTLLCERDHTTPIEASTSRNVSAQATSLQAFKLRILLNLLQTGVFVLHNTAGYLLMLAVMIYNFHLLLAVVLGMALGYFLFGAKLTRLQMQCFNTKAVVICTPECDDTAETSTPPLLDGSVASESDFFICQTRTCIQPTHYFPASTDGASTSSNPSCSYGNKKCPSKVARARQAQNQTTIETHNEIIKTTDLFEAEPLKTTSTCCKKKVDPEKEVCCKNSSQVEMSMSIQPVKKNCCNKVSDTEDRSENSSNGVDPGLEKDDELSRGESPKITCCAHIKSPSSESQEQIVK